jgi:aminoglycoside phosphotransferase (APT) family kinase protein
MRSEHPPLVDETRLGEYLGDHLPGKGPFSIERHLAGHSIETFRIGRSGTTWILRRPPRGAFLPSAHDVGREYTVLKGLAGTPVRAPWPLLMCDDESVIGAPFYVMDYVDGVVIRSELPEWYGANERRRIGEELVDALVELHDVEPECCGLGSFGRPHGYLERQLRRWTGQLELTLPMTRPLPDLERAGEWLRDNLPRAGPHTIVHGDYKLDNVAFSPTPPARLVAIFDWEMATLGDPLADLGWMISFWREAGDPADDVFAELNRVTTMPGFSRRADLIRRYERSTGRVADALVWYEVLATWKLAILLEGSYARHLAGATDDPFFAEMEYRVPALARRSVDRAERA